MPAVTGTLHLPLIFPSGQEWLIILVVGVLLFGRRLPEVGKQVGRVIIQLRQGMQKLREEIDLDENLQDVRETVEKVEYDLRESVDVDADTRRIATNPQSLLDDLTDEALSAPGPEPTEEVHDAPPPAGSLFGQESSQGSGSQGEKAKQE
jgi:TatA/E family protein of Tat protein translocase